MTRKRMICILFCLLLLPALASAQETVSISELKATAPERWICEIQTEQRGTVTIDAPVHIPDVDAVPLLMVSEAPFIYELAGDESFLIGKADVRKREEILDPDRFSEIGYPPEDLLDFLPSTVKRPHAGKAFFPQCHRCQTGAVPGNGSGIHVLCQARENLQ